MPRKTLDEQKYAFFGSRRHNQSPGPTVWGRNPPGRFGDESPARMRALDGWMRKRECGDGCLDCTQEAKVSRIRAMYGRKRR